MLGRLTTPIQMETQNTMFFEEGPFSPYHHLRSGPPSRDSNSTPMDTLFPDGGPYSPGHPLYSRSHSPTSLNNGPLSQSHLPALTTEAHNISTGRDSQSEFFLEDGPWSPGHICENRPTTPAIEEGGSTLKKRKAVNAESPSKYIQKRHEKHAFDKAYTRILEKHKRTPQTPTNIIGTPPDGGKTRERLAQLKTRRLARIEALRQERRERDEAVRKQLEAQIREEALQAIAQRRRQEKGLGRERHLYDVDSHGRQADQRWLHEAETQYRPTSLRARGGR